MVYFQCDYAEGAHPHILERLVQTNLEQSPGYGEDRYCLLAADRIRQACGQGDAAVHFLVGGTQANATVISSILRPHQGVLCAESGHINVHETGAIEHGGHKVLALPAQAGKITARQISAAVESHFSDASAEHIVQPGMVYLSFPTELGTLYTLGELADIARTCRKYDLPLFIDGARLGYGLASPACDVTLQELASLADIFYIGGTKQGALFGEAVVITRDSLKPDFRYLMKQGGGMLAKGRLLGIQFDTLFTGNLYFDLARAAVEKALRIRDAFAARGKRFLVESPTNQQFPILTKGEIRELERRFVFERWAPISEEETGVRFCTSWATTDEAVGQLLEAIGRL